MKHKLYGLLSCLFLCLTMLLPTVDAYASESAIRSVTVHIPVMCICETCEEEFDYVLTPTSTLNQSFDKTSFTARCDYLDSFGITYTYPGTYHYTITQTVGTSPDVTYDTSVYDVDVYVTDDGSANLIADVVAYKSDSDVKVENISFTNAYHGTIDVPNHPDKPETPIDDTSDAPSSAVKPTAPSTVRPVSVSGTPIHSISSSNQSAPNVQTSDTGTVAVYLVCIVMAALAIALILFRKRGASDESK